MILGLDKAVVELQAETNNLQHHERHKALYKLLSLFDDAAKIVRNWINYEIVTWDRAVQFINVFLREREFLTYTIFTFEREQPW